LEKHEKNWKNMKRMSLIVLALLAASCQPNDFYKREVPRLEGWSETRLVGKFGSPVRVGTNTVAEYAHDPEAWRPPTPQVLTMFPTNVEANLKVPIRALSWQQGRIMVTAFLREKEGHWITLYAEEWNMDTME
jgi:hypothetical protein